MFIVFVFQYFALSTFVKFLLLFYFKAMKIKFSTRGKTILFFNALYAEPIKNKTKIQIYLCLSACEQIPVFVLKINPATLSCSIKMYYF
jgi:hypothetical protein